MRTVFRLEFDNGFRRNKGHYFLQSIIKVEIETRRDNETFTLGLIVRRERGERRQIIYIKF